MKRLIVVFALFTALFTLAACNVDSDTYNGRDATYNGEDSINDTENDTQNGEEDLDDADDMYNGDNDTQNGEDEATNGDEDLIDEDEATNGDEDLIDEDEATNGDEDVIDEDEAADDDEDTNDEDEVPNDDEDSLRVFTLDELAEYDGLDGNDAYIAVDGVVYDVTNSSHWIDGIHQGRYQAGRDLTNEIDNLSPHGRGVLDNIPIIGEIAEEE